MMIMTLMDKSPFTLTITLLLRNEYRISWHAFASLQNRQICVHYYFLCFSIYVNRCRNFYLCWFHSHIDILLICFCFVFRFVQFFFVLLHKMTHNRIQYNSVSVSVVLFSLMKHTRDILVTYLTIENRCFLCAFVAFPSFYWNCCS